MDIEDLICVIWNEENPKTSCEMYLRLYCVLVNHRSDLGLLCNIKYDEALNQLKEGKLLL